MIIKYAFAPNAVALPADPNAYKPGIAYKLTVTSDFVAKGYSTAELVDTARLNQYFFDLTTIIIKLSQYGVKPPDLANMVDAKEGDLALANDGQLTLKVFKNNSWQNWAIEATSTSAGIVLKTECFISDSPWQLLTQNATHKQYGFPLKNDFILKNDLSNNCCASIHRSSSNYSLSEAMEERYHIFQKGGSRITINKSDNEYPIMCLGLDDGAQLEIEGIEKETVLPRNLYTLPDGTWCASINE